MRHLNLVVLLALAAGVSGCIASRSFQPASTIGHGRTQAGVEANVFAFVPESPSYLYGPIPAGAASVTYGFADRLDGTLIFGQAGVGAQLKFALLQNRAPGGITLSIAPYAGGGFWLLGYGYDLELPLLLSYRITERSELTVGATTKSYYVLIDSLAGTNDLSAWESGGTASYSFWPKEWLRVTGGVGALYVHRADQRPDHSVDVQASLSVALIFPIESEWRM